MQSLSAKPYAGKRFIYRAAVRVEGKGPADSAMLWFRVDLPNQGIGFFDNMRDRPIRSGDWAVYEIKGEVDLDATRINFGSAGIGTTAGFQDNYGPALPGAVDVEAMTADVYDLPRRRIPSGIPVSGRLFINHHPDVIHVAAQRQNADLQWSGGSKVRLWEVGWCCSGRIPGYRKSASVAR